MMTRKQSLQIIWDALQALREQGLTEGIAEYDDQWDEICEAMAFVHEAFNVSHDEID